MSIYVIYHRADFDGILSGAICNKFLEDVKLVGWDYGDLEPEIPDSCTTIYLVDLSIPGLMADSRLIWIDHHKTAIEKYPATIKGYRIDGVAACRLCWQLFDYDRQAGGLGWTLPKKDEYIDRKVKEPLLVRLAGEFDTWDKRDPDAELLQYGLASWKYNAYNASGLGMSDSEQKETEAFIRQGQIVQTYVEAKNKQKEKAAYAITWEGLKFKVLNSRGNSLIFKGFDLSGIDALALWSYNGATGKYKHSLYHSPGREDLDLSVIAQKYGGGGHRGACGFETDLPVLV